MRKPKATDPSKYDKALFVARQKWIGWIVEINGTQISARMESIKGEHSEIDIVFDQDDIAPEDYELVRPGAVFYLSIGHLDDADGQRINGTVIKFQRLPRWSASDLKKAEAAADEWRGLVEGAT